MCSKAGFCPDINFQDVVFFRFSYKVPSQFQYVWMFIATVLGSLVCICTDFDITAMTVHSLKAASHNRCYLRLFIVVALLQKHRKNTEKKIPVLTLLTPTHTAKVRQSAFSSQYKSSCTQSCIINVEKKRLSASCLAFLFVLVTTKFSIS